MRASKSNRMKNCITNKVLNERRRIEFRISDWMDLEKERRFNQVKREYYLRNPQALKYVPANLETGGNKEN